MASRHLAKWHILPMNMLGIQAPKQQLPTHSWHWCGGSPSAWHWCLSSTTSSSSRECARCYRPLNYDFVDHFPIQRSHRCFCVTHRETTQWPCLQDDVPWSLLLYFCF